MKLTLAIPALAALLMTTGCTTLLTTEPFVAEGEAVLDRGLLGVWGDKDDTLIIKEKGKGYEITLVDGKDTLKFEAKLLRIGEVQLLDLTPDTDNPFVLPLHAAVRVWPEGNTLRWTFFDSDWAKEQAVSSVPTLKSGDRTVVTAGARELVRRLGGDERALGKVDVWTRAQ